TFTVDTQFYGTKTVHAYIAGTPEINADNSFKIIPAIHTVTPATGTVGRVITVAGNGYGWLENVEIGFGTTSSIANPQCNTIGQFSVSWTVNTQVYGTCAVVGTGSGVATSTFFCLPHIVSVTPTSATVGRLITITGDGYIGNANGSLTFGTYQGEMGTASSSGTFSTIWTLNEQVGGSLTITAISIGAGHESISPFYINANVHTLTPLTGTVGTWVELTGNGYRESSAIRVHFGTTQSIATTSASGIVNGLGGTFTACFTINTQPYGTTTITVAGAINAATISFTILPNIFRVSPDTGTVGTRVTVAGNGYPIGSITINSGNKSAIATGTMGTYGSFTLSFTIDTQIYGTTNIIGVGTAGVSFTRTLVIQPNIWQVSPNNGTVGCSITVYGNGYGQTEPVQIDFGTTQAMTSTTTANNGSWTARFTVNKQSIGSNTVTATGSNTGVVSISSFLVKPKITNITPTAGSVGTVVTILTGNGYQALELVRVDFGNTSSITQVSVEADGAFLTSFTIDTQRYGTTTAVAQGVTSFGSSSIGFKIIPNIVSVSPSEGTVGTMITVTGDGFEYGQIGISFGYTPTIIQTMSNENGSFTISFVSDTQVYGTQAVKAYMTGNPNVFAEKTFFIWQTIDEVTPNRGTVGSIITVKGTGFDADDVMILNFGNSSDLAQPQASNRGSWTATFLIDTQPYGTTTVAVRGARDTAQGTSTTLIILPGIYSVLPAEGSVGTIVTVIGNGFVATDIVSITFGNTSGIATGTVGSNGLWTANFTINTQPLGWTTISASGTMATMATSTCRIIPAIAMISPQSGTVGTVVSIEGNGYNNEQVNIAFGDREIIATITASIGGTFATSFVVDTQRYGTTSVGAVGGTSGVPAQEKIFVIRPAVVKVTPTIGTVGSLVTVYGNGYGSEHLIQVNFGTTPNIVQTTSEVCGSWTVIFTVDIQKYGITGITAKDGDISATNNSFTVWPNIILSPTSGIVGSQVTVQGNGYGENGIVDINFGTTPTVIQGVANGSGVFTTSFTINLQPYGTTTVRGVGSIPVIPEKPFNILSKVTGVTPAVGSVTTMVTVCGNGFGAIEKIWVKFGTTVSITSTTTDMYGSWTATFSIDTQGYGTKTITAVGVDSGRSDQGIVKVVARIYQVLPVSGTVGSMVTIYGDGYLQESLTFKFGKYNVTSVNGGAGFCYASPVGSFSAFFVVSTQSAGTTTITATGDPAKSDQIVENTYYINGKILGVVPSSGTVGSRVTVSGNGFISSDSVRIDFGQSQSIAVANTSVDGTFSVGFTVDIKPMGTGTVLAVDKLTTDSKIFMVKSALTAVSPTTGTVGTIVSVSGNGFQSGEQIWIDFGSKITMTTTTATVNGTIGITWTVDEQQNGNAQINATGITTGATGTIGFNITHNLVNITPISGTVGSRVTVYGNGYVPGTITIGFGNKPGFVNSAINSNGSFTVGFTVDTQGYGSTTTTAQDTQLNKDTEVYLILSHITQVSPLSGTVGSLVTVSGDGYGTVEQIRLGFGTNNSITTVITGNGGSFANAVFTVDIQPSGTVTVTAAGVLDQVKHVDTDEYRIKGNIV
ncbi:hypothetical protein COX18_08985, partial [Candidatus Desantisbacteria bacterium CG23_combo_of_CG06-09_8_20_14_all_40_23]